MPVDEFPKNSKIPANQPPPEKKITPVVEGSVTTKKPGLGRMFVQTFTGFDARGAMEYVVLDVLIPAAKNMVADAVSQGTERMIFGEARSVSRSGPKANAWTPYGKFSTTPSTVKADPITMSRQARATHNFDDIVLNNRVDAERVINGLYDLLNEYEVVSVKDLYSLLGVTSAYTDQSWGWTDLRGSDIVRITQGYLLKLPKAQPI